MNLTQRIVPWECSRTYAGLKVDDPMGKEIPSHRETSELIYSKAGERAMTSDSMGSTTLCNREVNGNWQIRPQVTLTAEVQMNTRKG